MPKWALEDMSDAIDKHQYSSIKGSSTTHCLFELLDVLYRSIDKYNTVGSLVVTDFPRLLIVLITLLPSKACLILVLALKSSP